MEANVRGTRIKQRSNESFKLVKKMYIFRCQPSMQSYERYTIKRCSRIRLEKKGLETPLGIFISVILPFS